MSVLFILLTASLSVSVVFLLAFIWSVKNRQFDDQYASSMRILFEDKSPAEQNASSNAFSSKLKEDPEKKPETSKNN